MIVMARIIPILTINLMLLSFGAYASNEINFLSMPLNQEDKVSKKCASELKVLQENLKIHTPWAFEMWESSAREAMGLLQGNKFQMGNFEQCIGLHEVSKEGIQRKYCLSKLRIDQKDESNENIADIINGTVWAVCSPESCSNEDLIIIMKEYPYIVRFLAKFNLTYRVIDNECQTNQSEEPYTFGSKAFIFCCIVLLTIASLSTIHHLRYQDDCCKIIKAFSVSHNFKELIKVDQTPLMFFHGFKVLASLSIIFGHQVGFELFQPVMNSNYAKSLAYESILGKLGRSVGDAVDCFFVMSGFFAMATIAWNFDKKNKLQIIFSRYFRMMPLLAFLIFFMATLYRQLGQGSSWYHVERESSSCAENWWTNVLYINNYVNTDKMCLTPSWFLACDFHFYLIAVALCYLLTVPSREKLGLSIAGLLLLSSMLITAFITYYHRLFPAFVAHENFLENFSAIPEMVHSHYPSHTRMAPYMIGIILACICQKFRNVKTKISNINSYIIIMGAMLMFSANSLYGVSFPGAPYDVISSTVHAALHRSTAGLCFAIIIVICIFGDMPMITSFLGSAPMVILGKLTFGASLISIPIQVFYLATPNHSKIFSLSSYFKEMMWVLGETFFLSLVTYLIVEAPFNNLMRILMKKDKLNPEKKEN